MRREILKRIILISMCLFLAPMLCFAQKPRVLQRSLLGNPGQKYILQLSKNYDSTKKCPLFIAIHWYTGNALQQINEWGFIANKQDYILLCPDFASGYQNLKHAEDKRLIQIIEEVKQEFSVDENNIFLVGYSGGAQFAHRFAFKHPEYIKAACIIAAGDYESPPSNAKAKKVKYLVGVGNEDERYGLTFDFYNRLKKRDYDVRFESFPLIGHTLHSKIKDAVINFLRNIRYEK